MTLLRMAAIVAALTCSSRIAHAQATGYSVAALADSIAAGGDTTRAYALLDSALHRNKRDGAAWHEFGLLNWNLAKSKRNGGYIGDQRVVRWLRGADTALRLATQFAPDSARYWLTLGKFNLTSGVSTMRSMMPTVVSNHANFAWSEMKRGRGRDR